jgi:anti-anti-sigma factor
MKREMIMMRFAIEDLPEPFRTTRVRHGDTVVVMAYGEIDVSSVVPLRAELRDLLTRHRRVVLDLRQVVFIDSSGLHCLLDIDRESRGAGIAFELVAGGPQVQRLFELTRTTGCLRFVDPVEPSGAQALSDGAHS